MIVGRDIDDRREFARMTRSAMLWGLFVMALFGIGGGYWVSRKLSRASMPWRRHAHIMKATLPGGCR